MISDVHLCLDVCKIDLPAAAFAKLRVNEAKYPADEVQIFSTIIKVYDSQCQVRGKSKKYTEYRTAWRANAAKDAAQAAAAANASTEVTASQNVILPCSLYKHYLIKAMNGEMKTTVVSSKAVRRRRRKENKKAAEAAAKSDVAETRIAETVPIIDKTSYGDEKVEHVSDSSMETTNFPIESKGWEDIFVDAVISWSFPILIAGILFGIWLNWTT